MPKLRKILQIHCEVYRYQISLTPIAPAVSTLSRRLPFPIVTSTGGFARARGAKAKLAAISAMPIGRFVPNLPTYP